jgi:hypothetical protein
MENIYKSYTHKQSQISSRKQNNNIQKCQELYAKYFNDFYTLVNPICGMRAKKKTLYDLRFSIEDIYCIAFLKYTHYLRLAIKDRNFCEENGKTWPKFNQFIYDFYLNKYKKNKKVIIQNCLDLMLTTYFYQEQNDDIRIFSNFLKEEYNTEDLLFFLFLRNNIEKELGISFIDKAKDETEIQHKENKEVIFFDFYLNQQQCSKIICQVFNLEDEILINQVIKKIEPYLRKEPKDTNVNCITTQNFMVILTDDFHNSRAIFCESKGINNVPLWKNKKNEFFDLSNNPDENTHKGYINMIEYFNNQDGNFEDNLKYVLLTYIKEKEILNFFDKYFEGEFNENLEEIIYDIRNSVTQKFSF